MPDEKLARAINSKVRRNIMHLLVKKKELSVYEVAQTLALSEPSASKHLKKLYDLGIVDFEDKGRKRCYFLKVKEIKQLVEVYDKVVQALRGD